MESPPSSLIISLLTLLNFHSYIACRHWLYNMKVVETPDCLHCNKDDTILHFFIYCPRITEFLTSFIAWWNRIAGTTGTINEIIFIFGVKIDSDEAITFNYCLISAKYFIYINRSNNSDSFIFYKVLVFLKKELTLEYQMYTERDDIQTF